MGLFVIEFADEVVEARLLPQDIGACRLGGFFPQRQMHALMATVLLRMSRFDALNIDPEPEPPDGQL